MGIANIVNIAEKVGLSICHNEKYKRGRNRTPKISSFPKNDRERWHYHPSNNDADIV
jgi:hypothetical protein